MASCARARSSSRSPQLLLIESIRDDPRQPRAYLRLLAVTHGVDQQLA